MRFVIFGLTVTTSWGNGHATLWRGLLRALARDGHESVFFERDLPYYAPHRDLEWLEGCDVRLYATWADVVGAAKKALSTADVAIVTSYCPDGPAACALVCDSRVPCRVFYDLDSPITLDAIERNEPIDYLPRDGLGAFDLVLSYAGGHALEGLKQRLGARRVAPLYGSVDPQAHRPAPPREEFRADLSYLGTWAADRQRGLEALLLEPARSRPGARFLIGGAQYPHDFPWAPNVFFVRHIPPPDHPAFFGSSRFTLNVTRAAMARFGWCPSGRLFEAAACGVPIVSDGWDGLDAFFEPDREIRLARHAEDVLAALDLADDDRERQRRAARERVLGAHTATHRAREPVDLVRA